MKNPPVSFLQFVISSKKFYSEYLHKYWDNRARFTHLHETEKVRLDFYNEYDRNKYYDIISSDAPGSIVMREAVEYFENFDMHITHDFWCYEVLLPRKMWSNPNICISIEELNIFDFAYDSALRYTKYSLEEKKNNVFGRGKTFEKAVFVCLLNAVKLGLIVKENK